MQAAEIRLLYENANTGIVVTIVIASLLSYAQWVVISRFIVSVWFLYMVLMSAARFLLVRRYWRASPSDTDNRRWNVGFVVGTAMAAAGWCAAAIVLYLPARPMNQTFLVFVVGGVMLGSASLLAPRPEAFLTFLLPTGLLTAVRLASAWDEDHLMMGFLRRPVHGCDASDDLAIPSDDRILLQLRFDNHDLIESLRTAKDQAEALNRDLELRVSDRTAKLVEADQRKDEFLATLAHELRNPLAPIRFALETVKAIPAGECGRAREVIDRQVRQLVLLVDDLLDVSRITANKIHLRREPLELGCLMATAVESIMPLATAADHQLDVRMPSKPIRVDGDGARLVQIFANVLNNAVKFTPHGGQIWFTAEQQSTEAVVRIRDTGIGVAPDVLPRVFDMFQQAAPILERSVGGLGIGLTLARRLVEMHEGRIVISSPGQPGNRGRNSAANYAGAFRESDRRRTATVAARRNLRVLIVEDNLDTAEMLELRFRKWATSPKSLTTARPQLPGDPVRPRRGFPGHRAAGDERLCGRASLKRAAGIPQRPYRRRHRMGPGRGSSKGTRSRVRQSLHQTALSEGAADLLAQSSTACCPARRLRREPAD